MTIITKIFILGVVLLVAGIITGCSQEYRYPCQNMENWDKPMCKKPLCSVHKDCPSHIFGKDPEFDGVIEK